jgi:hypothetical protein
MGVISTGQFTIVDYNDALTLTGFVTANAPKIQTWNPDNGAFNPDWSKTPYLILTPCLYKAGDSTDIITSSSVTSIKWYDASAMGTEIVNGAGGGTYAIPATGVKTLTIKSNLLDATTTSKDFVCVVQYRDATHQDLIITTQMSISFARVVNGGGIADAVVWAPAGNIFKNGTIASLTAHCDLLKGSMVDATSTYQWYMQETGATDDSSIPQVGLGWHKLIDGANFGCSGYSGQDLTVPNTAVPSLAVFKCVAKDTETSTYYYDTINFIDQSDTVQVVIESTGGDVFKNGIGTTNLTCRLFRGGTEIDAYVSGKAESAYTYIYTWSLLKSDGSADKFYNSTSLVKDITSRTGKRIAVDGNDIDVKGTVKCEVSTR